MSTEEFNDEPNKDFPPVEIITPRDGPFAISDRLASSIARARKYISISVPWLDMGFVEPFRAKGVKGLTILLLTKKPERGNSVDERIIETAEALRQLAREKDWTFQWHVRERKPLHDKFMIIDGDLALAGSLNYTTAGRYHNSESLHLYRCQSAINSLIEWFKFMWKPPNSKAGRSCHSFTSKSHFDPTEAREIVFRHLREHENREKEGILLQLLQSRFPSSSRCTCERLLEQMNNEGAIYSRNEEPRVYSSTF